MAKLCYNGEKEMCLLGMLDMSQKELESIKGDKYMDRLKEEAVKINNDEEMIKLLSDEDEERLYINTMKEIGKEEGVKEDYLIQGPKTIRFHRGSMLCVGIKWPLRHGFLHEGRRILSQ